MIEIIVGIGIGILLVYAMGVMLAIIAFIALIIYDKLKLI